MQSKDKNTDREKIRQGQTSAGSKYRQKHWWTLTFPVFSRFLKKYLSFNKIIRRGILVLSAVLVGFCLLFLNYSVSPIDRNNLTVVVNIPTGSSFLESVEILNRAGLIKNRLFFLSLATFKKAGRHIRAGEYEFNTMITPWTLIDKLVRGEIKQYRVSIPEDLSLRDIAEILDKDKLINKDIFFQLARDKEFLTSLHIQADSIEGYLFPETYFFNRSMNTRSIMQKMVDTFWQNVTPVMIKKANDIGMNVHQLVTFASMIGKESADNSEKPLIAAVFKNRLKKGMRLQSDPTAVYDMHKFEGKVLRSHLRRSSPYNTYLIQGLPPGPIANPGLDSIKATLNPASVDYLYFVSKQNGTHYFSSSLAEHNLAVQRYINKKDEQTQELDYNQPHQIEENSLQKVEDEGSEQKD
ncbi:MAG TPA: endolytic transglycosylase MltG [Smithella sp.]|nr:endolytic transglycosylase MltG [Smithella sp.]HNY49579.1 endolytic transglycosylase MltG [Smithella sp.]HOG89352.1 endolytic transglycosylase MltG [Smithella sp.]HOU50114.1 endolytic transglycosylase MltG [Smithella sp.]HQG64696.1 endolytic transglycosylase MltG [Smithella sp.]